MFKKVLFTIFIVIWLILAIEPKYREDWFIENILTLLSLPLILYLNKKYIFSNLSALAIFIFALFHSIGAHYTYAEMEYFNCITEFFHLNRNNYDRVVHFLFGLIVFIPLFEVIYKVTNLKKISLFLTLLILFSASSFFEILEWIVAEITNPELGTAYLGTQGDEFDSQKDITLGLLGAFITFFIYWKLKVKKELK